MAVYDYTQFNSVRDVNNALRSGQVKFGDTITLQGQQIVLRPREPKPTAPTPSFVNAGAKAGTSIQPPMQSPVDMFKTNPIGALNTMRGRQLAKESETVANIEGANPLEVFDKFQKDRAFRDEKLKSYGMTNPYWDTLMSPEVGVPLLVGGAALTAATGGVGALIPLAAGVGSGMASFPVLEKATNAIPPSVPGSDVLAEAIKFGGSAAVGGAVGKGVASRQASNMAAKFVKPPVPGQKPITLKLPNQAALPSPETVGKPKVIFMGGPVKAAESIQELPARGFQQEFPFMKGMPESHAPGQQVFPFLNEMPESNKPMLQLPGKPQQMGLEDLPKRKVRAPSIARPMHTPQDELGKISRSEGIYGEVTDGDKIGHILSNAEVAADILDNEIGVKKNTLRDMLNSIEQSSVFKAAYSKYARKGEVTPQEAMILKKVYNNLRVQLHKSAVENSAAPMPGQPRNMRQRMSGKRGSTGVQNEEEMKMWRAQRNSDAYRNDKSYAKYIEENIAKLAPKKWWQEAYNQADIRTKNTPMIEMDLTDPLKRAAIASDPGLSYEKKIELLKGFPEEKQITNSGMRTGKRGSVQVAPPKQSDPLQALYEEAVNSKRPLKDILIERGASEAEARRIVLAADNKFRKQAPRKTRTMGGVDLSREVALGVVKPAEAGRMKQVADDAITGMGLHLDNYMKRHGKVGLSALEQIAASEPAQQLLQNLMSQERGTLSGATRAALNESMLRAINASRPGKVLADQEKAALFDWLEGTVKLTSELGRAMRTIQHKSNPKAYAALLREMRISFKDKMSPELQRHVSTFLGRQQPSKVRGVLDALDEYMMNSMLSSGITPSRNLFGMAYEGLVGRPVDALGGAALTKLATAPGVKQLLNKLGVKVSNPRYFSEIPLMFSEYVRNLSTASRLAWESAKISSPEELIGKFNKDINALKQKAAATQDRSTRSKLARQMLSARKLRNKLQEVLYESRVGEVFGSKSQAIPDITVHKDFKQLVDEYHVKLDKTVGTVQRAALKKQYAQKLLNYEDKVFSKIPVGTLINTPLRVFITALDRFGATELYFSEKGAAALRKAANQGVSVKTFMLHYMKNYLKPFDQRYITERTKTLKLQGDDLADVRAQMEYYMFRQRHNNWVGKAMRKIGSTPIIRSLIPFLTTKTNIELIRLDRSGVGFVKMFAPIIKNIMQGENAVEGKAIDVREGGRALGGLLMTYLTYEYLKSKGAKVVGPAATMGQRKQRSELQSPQAYIQWKDGRRVDTLNLGTLSGLISNLGVYEDYVRRSERGEPVPENVSKTAFQYFESVVENSPYYDARKLLEMADQMDNKVTYDKNGKMDYWPLLQNFYREISGRAIPQVLRETDKTGKVYGVGKVKEPDKNARIPRGFNQTMRAEVPGNKSDILLKRTQVGTAYKRRDTYSPFNPKMWEGDLPGKDYDDDTRAILLEYERLGIDPTSQRQVSGKVALTREEADAVQAFTNGEKKLMGIKMPLPLRSALAKLIRNPAYEKLDEPAKVIALEKVKSRYTSTASDLIRIPAVKRLMSSENGKRQLFRAIFPSSTPYDEKMLMKWRAAVLPH